MYHRRGFSVIFWSLVVLGFVFLLGNSSPVIADLGNSNVTFAPSVEYEPGKFSDSCYIPGEYWQTLCFNLDTTTTDGEDADIIITKFPGDWEVGGFWKSDHYEIITVEQSCSNGGTMSPLLSWMGYAVDGQYWGGDARVQNGTETCHATYCFSVDDKTDPGNPPYTDTDANVSWAWSGDISTVCTNDDFYPGWPCTETTGTPAIVPVCEFVPITILPETLPNALAGHFYTQQLSPTNPNPADPDYTYTTSGGMPDDFSLYYNTGKIDWNNPQVGSYTFTAYVEGPGWSEGSREYTIVVDPELIFTPDPLPPARQYTAYDQPITVSGGTAPYALSLESGTLPIGLSFTDGSFTGTPTEFGTFADLVVRATDANEVSQTHTYSLKIYPEHLFTWTPTNPVSGEQATFTGEAGFDYYEWSYGYYPGGECDTTLWGFEQQKMITLYGKGDHKVCLRLTDYNPTFVVLNDEQWVTVTNGSPSIGSYWDYPDPSFPGSPVEVGVDFFDYDGPGTFTCEIDWGDGTVDTTYPGFEDWECGFPAHIYDTIGNYQLEVSVTDDEGASSEATFTHQVVYIYAEGSELILASNSLTTLLTLYGFAPEGTESLQFDITTNPEHGSLGVPNLVDCTSEPYLPGMAQCWATVLFTPTGETPPYVGSDFFEFTVSDLEGHTSDPATINLWLDENDPPTADDGTALVSTVGPSRFSIFGTDMDVHDYVLDELTFYIDTPPQYGTLQFEEESNISEWLYDGSWNVIGAEWAQLLTYTPNPGTIAATDTFTFHINDTHQDSNIATVTLTLHAPISLHVNVNDDLVDADGCNETHCSLREAVADALIGDTIDFTLSLPNTITLTWDGGGELVINKNINIVGPGADQLTISAGFMDPALPEHPSNGFRVFHIYNDDDPVRASISGLTIRDGRGFEGGGIFVDENAELNLTDCQVGPNNIVEYAGGGISTDEAVLTMTNCTVIENHGTGSQGGAGMFLDRSDVTIINSTITGNITNNFGGGILIESSSDITIIHSTISGNTSNQDYDTFAEGGGGGIFVRDNCKLTLWNTIVAGNTDLTEPSEHAKWPDFYGEVTSLGGNLIGDNTGSTGWLPGDMVGTSASPIDPLLGTLDVHEPGTTPTFSLLEGSPAIDTAVCAAGVTTDQRGVKRPQGMACDRGAFEVENPLTYLFIPLILR